MDEVKKHKKHHWHINEIQMTCKEHIGNRKMW